MSLMGSRRIKRNRSGSYEMRLPDGERTLLLDLVKQLRTALTEGADGSDTSLRRLFPTAYVDDAERDAEYQELVHDDLLERRLAALDVVEETANAARLEEEQLLAWMGAVNDLRLVLGTRLDVSEDMDHNLDADDPTAFPLAVYDYLSMLLETIVAAASRATRT
jgi:hypothetical protein